MKTPASPENCFSRRSASAAVAPNGGVPAWRAAWPDTCSSSFPLVSFSWDQTPLRRLFTVESDMDVLHTKAIISRIKTTMRQNRIFVNDLWRFLDQDSDGRLSCTEVRRMLCIPAIRSTHPASVIALQRLYGAEVEDSTSPGPGACAELGFGHGWMDQPRRTPLDIPKPSTLTLICRLRPCV